MVAELRIESAPPELWFIPDRPAPRQRCKGWRYVRYWEGRYQSRPARQPEDDEDGLMAQEIIFRYVLGGWPRSALAKAYGYSERQIQGIVGGDGWTAYTAPVRRWLRGYGIDVSRGKWQRGGEGRAVQVVYAQRAVLARLLACPHDPIAQRDARIFTTDWESIDL